MIQLYKILTTAKLIDFFYENRKLIITEYKKLSKNAVNAEQKKSSAFFAVKDLAESKNIIMTQCQINKILAMIINDLEE